MCKFWQASARIVGTGNSDLLRAVVSIPKAWVFGQVRVPSHQIGALETPVASSETFRRKQNARKESED